MLRRILSRVAGFGRQALEQTNFRLGTSVVCSPSGWRASKRTDERLILTSADGHQQATVSTLRFNIEPTIVDFNRMCDLRVKAERKLLADGFIDPGEPFKGRDGFGMVFYGGEKKTGRLFSGYLVLRKRQLLTIYVEGVDVGYGDHLETFQVFIRGLRNK